ncbi:MAG: hypothetical protein U9O18_06425, partial [Chloroflexota bacterium]|nr:hypothetical protein [Chloroflexota bacterium]
MTVSGFVIPAFLIVTVVVLVLLWRRGPEKRGAFFVAGLLIVSVVFVLAVTLDGVERAIDEGVEEWRESWQSSLVTRPSDELIEATGVSVTFPRRMEISEADIWVYDDVYPVPGSPLRWEPLYVASEPESWCTVMDATDYAAALDYWRLEDAVAAELTGIEERRGDMLLARISRPLVGLREGGLSSGYYDLPLGRAAYVDLENAGGFSRRHYIVNATDRWIILSCYARDADRLPSDRWESVADSLTVRPARATFEPALSPGPVDKVPAGGGVATPIPAALSLNLTEAALRDIVPFDDCRERFSGMIAGAKVVITCQVDGGVDGDAEVTYAQFDSLKRLQRWWDKEAEGVRAYSFDDALLRCRNGTSAEADHATGRFLCRRKGLRFRVSWTDKGRFLGGIATSDTMPLPDLLEQWQEGDFEPGATKRKVKPTPAATRPPAVAPGADPPGPTPQPEARLRDHVPLEGCRSRKLDTVPGAEAVITCPAGEWVEVTYAGFSRIADLEDWWEQEAGSIRT